MSKFDKERIRKLRSELSTELQELLLHSYLNIFTDLDETYIHIIYDGKSVCKIRTDGDGYDVEFTNEFDVNDFGITQWSPGYRTISDSIRDAIFKYEKGQKNMTKLEELRDYLYKEIGNTVTVIYDRAIGPHNDRDRIRIKRNDLVVCSIYNTKTSLFNVIFYDPYICRSEGYSVVINITLEEVPKAIKNRINICEDTNDDPVLKSIYMMTARGSGKTRWISEMFKNSFSWKDNIKDVIFNNPATIVFWVDGSKTVVKCQPGETFDPEKGLAMAISKKVLGNDYGYYETFAKHVGRYNKKHKEK